MDDTSNNEFELYDFSDNKINLIIHKKYLLIKKLNHLKNISKNCLLGVRLYEAVTSTSLHKLEIYFFKRNIKEIKLNVFHTVEKKETMKSLFYSKDLEKLRSVRSLIFDLMYSKPPPENYKHEENMDIYISNKKEKPEGFRISAFKCDKISKYPMVFKKKYDKKFQTRFYKRVLITINPGSGKGKAMENFQGIQEVLRANGIIFITLISQKRGDVQEHLYRMPLESIYSFDGIFCFSGDGHIHEVINALMLRKDYDMKEKPITIAHFPCGSGCVLAEYMSKITNCHNSIDTVLAAVCRWRTTKIPIFKYQIEKINGEIANIFSFLSLSIGFFADVDIESEFLRFMGNGRFGLYGIWRYLILKKYKLNVNWKRENIDSMTGFGEYGETLEPKMVSNSAHLRQIEKKLKIKSSLEIIPEQPSMYEENFIEKMGEIKSSFAGKLFSLMILTLPFLSKNHMCSPSLLQSLGLFNLQLAPSSMGRSNFYKYISNHENHYPSDHPEIIDELTNEIEISLHDKTLSNSQKPHGIELVIDGESYKFLNFKKIKAVNTNLHFNLIL